MLTEQQIGNRANISMSEKAKRDKDRVLKIRKSPNTRNMLCLKIGSAEFYFDCIAKLNYFWKGDKHYKGYREKLKETHGKKYVDNLKVKITDCCHGVQKPKEKQKA